MNFHRLAAPGKKEELRRMNGSYHCRQRASANEPSKQPQRERIADHLLLHHHGEFIKLFSLPGQRWYFENTLALRTAKPLYVVGTEWNCGTLELGRPYMFYQDAKPWETTFHFTNGDLKMLRSDRAVWAWCHAGHLLGKVDESDLGEKHNRARFNRLFKGINAWWLDFTSPICEEVEHALNGVHRFLDVKAPVVPFAVTVLAGRESRERLASGSDLISRRVPVLQAALEKGGHCRCEISEAWSYNSERGARMLNVTGLLHQEVSNAEVNVRRDSGGLHRIDEAHPAGSEDPVSIRGPSLQLGT